MHVEIVVAHIVLLIVQNIRYQHRVSLSNSLGSCLEKIVRHSTHSGFWRPWSWKELIDEKSPKLALCVQSNRLLKVLLRLIRKPQMTYVAIVTPNTLLHFELLLRVFVVLVAQQSQHRVIPALD